jgi:HSP20 family protein
MLPATRNNLTATTPWMAPVNRLERLFDRFFDDSFFNFGFTPDWGAGVPVSLWQDDDHVYVEAELPGLTDQDVDVTVHNGMLFIRGERKPEEGRQYLYNGRVWGRFERVITLPEAVDADNVQAELTNGILRVALPKSPEAKPKKIALKTS